MKMIRRSWMLLIFLLAVMLSFPGAMFAAQKEAAGRYDAVSCMQDGDHYTCEGEYLLLNEDGSGEICYNGSVYSLEWTLNGTSLTFTDQDDYTSEGTLKDGVIKAVVYDYEYTYEKAGSSAAGSDSGSASGESADASSGGSLQDNVSDMQAGSADSASVSQAAGSEEGPAVYYVSSRLDAGTGGASEADWSNDYIALNDDGTGIFLFNNAAFSMTWKQEGSTFSFTDHLGNQFQGTTDGRKISGKYARYEYTFELTGATLPVYQIAPDKWGKDLDYVTDQAGVLSETQLSNLSEKAKELTEEYDVGVYVVLLDSRDDFTWSRNIETLSEEIRSGYSIGVGYTEKKAKHESADVNAQWKDSILLTVAFDVRRYDLCASGEYVNWAFSDYARSYIRNHFVDDFKDNNWVSGLSDYLNEVEKVLKVSAKGKEFSYRNTVTGTLVGIFVPIILALLFGYGIAAAMRSSMQNTQKAMNAAAYVAGDEVNFTRREDYYIRTLVSRVYSPKEKSGGGGGGHSSSGSSHTSGSF